MSLQTIIDYHAPFVRSFAPASININLEHMGSYVPVPWKTWKDEETGPTA